MISDEQTPTTEVTPEVTTAVEPTAAPAPEPIPESTPTPDPLVAADSTITGEVPADNGAPLATANDEGTPADVNPATGENDDARAQRGLEGGQAEPAPEPEPEPVGDMTLTQLAFKEARMVLPDLQTWAQTNAVKVIHDEYQQHIQLIHAIGLELPPFIKDLIESQVPHV